MTSLAAAGQLQFKPRLGVLYMLGAIFVLGSTDAIVKWSTNNVDPIQIGFSRFVVSLIMVLWLVGRSQPGFTALRTKRPIEHAARAFCAAVELTAFYFAISLIPLPTAMSIVAASPIFGTLLGIVFLRERLRLRGWFAVFAGFIGMLLVVQPEEGANSLLGTGAVLTSVVLWCFAQLFARRLSTTESNLTILFYYAVGGVIILGIATPFVWVNPTPLEWAAIIAVGIFGCLGQYFLILALRYAPMSLLAPFEYSALVWACFYGYIFWGDVLGPVAIIGVVIIVAACLYITRTMEH
ncbi:DMT family transporter [Dongia deserti]|uniref:DMT family transporter n=1 Tax=Dongia deserti TaxID=2268030 RepID=UPI0013C45B2C|nr:DMT family transporter [Dongia deserti]